MRANVVEYPHIKWEKQRTFGLDKGFKDALGDYLRRRWPTSTAKMACKAFRGLSLDQARKAVNYEGSFATFELICKRGGPAVFLPIMEEVTGQSIARYLTELRGAHDQNTERLAALTSDLWPLRHPRRDDPPGVGDAGSERREPVRRRMG